MFLFIFGKFAQKKDMLRLNRLALICFILSGCSQISPYHQALKDAENIIEDKPDSALRILEQMTTAPMTNDEDVALYCLLLTQAKHRLYKPVDSDSMINMSILYFSRTNDKQHLAHSYYYKGAILRELGVSDSATLYFKEAEKLANEIQNNLILIKAYESLCNINNKSHDYELSLKYARQFLRSSEVKNDSSRISRAYYYLFSCLKNLNRQDSAKFYFQKGLQTLKQDSSYASYYYTQLAQEYYDRKDNDSAWVWLQKAIKLNPMPFHYILLGRIALKKGDSSEAQKLWEKALTLNNKGVEYDAYCCLRDLYSSQKKYKQAMLMNHKGDSVLFAYSREVRTIQLARIQQDHDKSVVEKELAEKKMHWLQGIIIALVIIVVLLVAILYYVNKVKQYKGIIDRNILQINETEQKIKFLESCGEGFTEEIATLKGQMASMRETTMEKLGMGRIVYDTIAKKEPLSGFSRDKEQAFVNYFAFTYPQQYADFGQSYKNLTLRHITFLILCHHFGMFDKEIEGLLNVSSSTIRNYRLRTKKVRHHTTPGTV